jgi:hypothetical protein
MRRHIGRNPATTAFEGPRPFVLLFLALSAISIILGSLLNFRANKRYSLFRIDISYCARKRRQCSRPHYRELIPQRGRFFPGLLICTPDAFITLRTKFLDAPEKSQFSCWKFTRPDYDGSSRKSRTVEARRPPGGHFRN